MMSAAGAFASQLRVVRRLVRPIYVQKGILPDEVAEGLRTASPDELSAAARRAVDRQQSLVIAVPVDYTDYRRLF